VTQQTIAEQAAAMNQAAAARPANPVMSVFADERARLAGEPAPEVPIGPGAPVPDGELLDVYGQPVTLHAALAGGPAVLVFYRGGWCPYCNIALATYQAQLLPELRQRGFGLIAVCPQKPDESLTLREKKELTFTVLSDPGNVLAARFGIVMTPSPDVIEAQLKLGLDLTQGNADGTTSCAGSMRTRTTAPAQKSATSSPRSMLSAAAAPADEPAHPRDCANASPSRSCCSARTGSGCRCPGGRRLPRSQPADHGQAAGRRKISAGGLPARRALPGHAALHGST
jgi:peroxiredoxin